MDPTLPLLQKSPQCWTFSFPALLLRLLNHTIFTKTTLLKQTGKLIQVNNRRYTPNLVFFSALIVLGLSTSQRLFAQSGKVFRDYNADGVKQATEPLIAGVIVKAYNTGNTECATGTSSTVADGSGNNYSLTGCSGAVRVEFTIPSAVAAVCGLADNLDYAAYGGAGYGSSVQFTTSAGTANFAVGNPHQYASPTLTNPKIFTSCYVSGNNLGAGNVGALDAFVGVDYTPTGNTTPAAAHYANAGQIGSTWGVAYSKQAKRVFTSAVLKRHTGLGPLGSGGIYMIDPSKQLPDLTGVTGFLDFDDIGIPTRGTGTYAGDEVAGNVVAFSDVIGSNADRKLGLNANSAEKDAQALAQAGRVSFGDLDLSDDGRYLYVMNLYDRKLYEIDLTDAANPVAPTSDNKNTKIRSWAIPEPCTSGTGDARPWGIDYYRGKPYIAVVCDAFTSQLQADLSFTIYELDPVSGVFDSKFTSTMTYARGLANGFRGDGNTRKGWFAWTDDWSKLTGGQGSVTWPQPILSDIEFDTDGSMVLGFIDRAGLQGGWNNKSPKTGDNLLYMTMCGGDLLRAYKRPSDCEWELEAAGKEGPSSPKAATGGATNTEGPGGGEFYYEEFFNSQHRETGLGGLGILFGSGDVVSTIYDPFRYDSFGLGWFDNTTGKKDDGYEIFFTNNNGQTPTSGTFSKGLSLGDVEIQNELPPLEIGNRIWKDTDKDGIQDAGEDGVDGVEIELYEGTTATGSPVKTVTSATLAGQKGTWYFTDLKPNQDYVIKVKTALGAGVLATCTAFSPTGAGTALIDNNTSTGTIVLKTGNAGENNHSFDIGVSEAPPVPKPGGWDFACEDGVMVETVGKSGFSVSNPAANCTGSGTATITIPNGASADSIYVEAVYKASNPGTSVTFKDAANNSYVAQRYTLPLGDGYVYRTKVPATASISLTDGTKFCALQSLVAYVFRKQSGMASTGVFTCEQGYQNTVTVNLPLPTLTKPSDVTVCVPISELTNDGRILQIKVTAGAIVKDTTITGSDPAFGSCCLAIPKLKLVNVPVGTTTVKVEIISPTTPAGQSFTVASAISANVECEKCIAPVAVATPKIQTICLGGTISAYTATPSTGVEYKWFGPLADTTGTLGTAIAGQTTASYTPTGTALTTAGTKYYAVIINNTGDVTCSDTAFVQLVVNAKPAIADGSATICTGESVNLTSKITGYDNLLSPVWTITTAGGTAVTTPTSVKPTTTTTYVLVAQNATGCKDTANVVVTVNPKPNAGPDQTLACANAGTNTLTTSTTLIPVTAGGTFTQIGTAPAVATITGNAVSGMTVAGTYQFQYSVAGCLDTVAVTVEPCTGCIKPDAGPDAAAVCQPVATAKLTAVTAGGTWAPIGSPANPSAATIDANGNITGLSAAGTYKFVYSVTGGGIICTDTAQVIVNAKPTIADGSATICAGESVDLTTKITGYDNLLSPVWTITTAGGTAVTTPTSVKPTTTTTYVLVAQNAAGCKDTANVVVTVNPKPNAGPDQTLACANAGTNTLTTSTTLVPSPTGGTYTQIGTTPAIATINGTAVTGMTIAGTYQFVYTLNGCKDTIAVTVEPCTGCVKPDAGADITLTCPPTGIAPTTATLVPVTAGGTWAAQTGNPATASITGNNVTGLTLAGTYKFIYSVTGGGQTCTDTVQVIVPTCLQPKGSLGDFVWKDADKDGKQDLGEAGVNGVKVILWSANTGGAPIAKLDSAVTAGGGKYLFTNLLKGDYVVQFVKATLPADCDAFTAKDTTAAGTTDKNDSDADKVTGITGKVSLDPKFLTGSSTPADSLATNNLTVDAGLINVCVKPNAGPDQNLTCAATQPTTADLVDAATGQKWKVLSVQPNTTVTVTTPAGAVSGMTAPGTYRFVLQTQSDSLACRDTVNIIVPDCTCPSVNVLTSNATVCKDSLFPTLSVAIIGNNTQGVTAAWYANATGGSSLSTGLNFKPTGVASVTDTFYVQLNGVTANCQLNPRTPVVMTVQDCTKEVDLALKKSINTKIAQIGDELTYTLKVYNQSNTGATGVEVTDSIATTVQFVTGSFTASRGSAAITGNVIKWTIGNIAANGDTVTLTYRVKATQEGVHFNTAEISKTNEKDIDSTPGNGKEGEDDIDHQCFTVPIKLCPGEKVQASVPASLTNVQWFKNGGTTSVASGNTVLLTEIGSYRFTATNQTCPVDGCCPVIIEPGVNCCPEDLCIPFTIRKRKK